MKFTNQQQVINWIYSFKTMAPTRNLDHLYTILADFDNPHLKLKTVHVAGTNGKGSTVAYLREALMQSGYKVATFTSPFITCFGERMAINNIPMSEANLVKYANFLAANLVDPTGATTSFDVLTLISFLYFNDADVDIAIYETGIGGRLDSTNVIAPLATAITNVGHDHADVLGDSQAARATEKLGIVKPNIPLFTTEVDPELLVLFVKTTTEKNAELVLALSDAELLTSNAAGVEFRIGKKEYKIKMNGKHQYKNATLAVNVLEYLQTECGFTHLDATKITLTHWQGRFELMQQAPPVIIDGAHNFEGIQALIATVTKNYPDKNLKFLFSAIATKDAAQMIALLAAIADELIFTQGTHFQSFSPEELAGYCEKSAVIYDDYQNALDTEIAKLTDEDVLVVCGSLYFIADVRHYLKDI